MIIKLTELYKNGGIIKDPESKERNYNTLSALSDKEGGYLEMK